jgi:hypothetical protein
MPAETHESVRPQMNDFNSLLPEPTEPEIDQTYILKMIEYFLDNWMVENSKNEP